MTEKELNRWWGDTNFHEMEIISRFRQSDFPPCAEDGTYDGYHDFVDACDNWWYEHDLESKRYIYDEYNR